MSTTKSQRTIQLSLAILALLATIAALKMTSTLVLPVLIALFIAAMVQPIMRKLKQFFPEGLSIVLLVIMLGVAMLLASLMFVSNVQAISAKVPEYTQRLQHMSEGLLKFAQGHGINITWDQIGAQKSVSWGLKFLTSGLTSFLSLTGQMFLVIFVLIFAMLEFKSFRDKFEVALGHRMSDEVTETILSISERIQQYALTKTSVSLLTGVCTWFIATLFGLDFAIFWGMLAFLLNYIPTIGSMIAVFPPVIIAFLQFGGWYQGIGVLAGLSAVQMVIGNILEPRMMGRSMNLSPLVVFLSMIFWGWLWDIAGMVMAVPLTVAIKIVCQHIDSLKPVAILLGDSTPPEDHHQPAAKAIVAIPITAPVGIKPVETDASPHNTTDTSEDSSDTETANDDTNETTEQQADTSEQDTAKETKETTDASETDDDTTDDAVETNPDDDDATSSDENQEASDEPRETDPPGSEDNQDAAQQDKEADPSK